MSNLQMWVEQARLHFEKHLPNQTEALRADEAFETHLNRLAEQAAETLDAFEPVLGREGAWEMARAELFPAPGEMEEDEEEHEFDPMIEELRQLGREQSEFLRTLGVHDEDL